MGAMDRVADGLYVGSIHTLSSPRDLHNHNITHAISLLRDNVRDLSEHGVNHLHVRIDDDDEEDIMKYFAETNKFIQQAHDQGSNVLIHCIAGISRSVTIAVAYLLRLAYLREDKSQLNVEKIIKQIKRKRSIANPNPSFREQLEIYLAEGCEADLKNPLYEQWIKRKQSEGIPLTGIKTESDKLNLVDNPSVAQKYEIGSTPEAIHFNSK